jgi:GT2 family glycosyltransferase
VVTVIVPFRDAAPLLRTCVDTVSTTAPGWALEWLLVDNGSTEPETATLLERLDRRPEVTVLADGRPFNWAALNNMAAAQATGELVLFLNNDIEAVRPGWLDALAVQALRPDVAAVGARLLYPGGRLQHAGVVLGMGGAAGHVLAGLAPGEPGYGGIAVLPREVSAVTGACLLSRRCVVKELSGFDEGLGMDLNDVDYCLRAWAAGYRVLYEPASELVHHESPSRGTSGSLADIRRFVGRWEGAIRSGDPFLNPNLTRVDSSCALRSPGEEEWWQRWRSILDRP